MLTWPTSSMHSSAAAQRRCYGPLPVNLDKLADILEGDPLNAGGRIDLMTGDVWAQAAIEYVLETGEEDDDSADDPERWLPVHNEGSREGYRDMESFIASVEDPGRAERLARAIARPRRVPPVQGRARTLAWGARAMVRTVRGAPTRPGSVVAHRGRLPRAARRAPQSLKAAPCPFTARQTAATASRP
jgi:hypothetical protein